MIIYSVNLNKYMLDWPQMSPVKRTFFPVMTILWVWLSQRYCIQSDVISRLSSECQFASTYNLRQALFSPQSLMSSLASASLFEAPGRHSIVWMHPAEPLPPPNGP